MVILAERRRNPRDNTVQRCTLKGLKGAAKRFQRSSGIAARTAAGVVTIVMRADDGTVIEGDSGDASVEQVG